MPANPLLEVFGYPANDLSADAANHRNARLCPFHNSSGINCTKNSVTDPLGVCSIRQGDKTAIVCPVRFRQDYRIYTDAARFFFPGDTDFRVLTEVALNDENEQSAGNVDAVLVSLDEKKHIRDFGALEVQAVYISGTIKPIFNHYMENPAANFSREWSKNPRPDYVSSSRKRLAPQLLYKGNILQAWKKKMAVVVHSAFFDALPDLPTTSPEEADLGWLVYDLYPNEMTGRFELKLNRIEYTRFDLALKKIAYAQPGNMTKFVQTLQRRIDQGKMIGMPESPEIPPTVLPPSRFDDIVSGAEDDFELDTPP